MRTEKERLIAILSGEEADRAPLICSGGMMSMATIEVMEMTQCYWPEAHRNPQKMARLVKAMHDVAGFENFGVPFCMTVEAEAFGSEVNYGSERVHPKVVKEAIQPKSGTSATLSDIKKLKEFNPQRDGRMPVILDAIGYLRDLKEETPIIGNLVGPTSLAGLVLEPLVLLRLMRKDKNAVHQLLSFITDNLIEFGKAQVRYGADVITISEPTGTGEILGPNPFSEFVTPYVNKIAGVLRKLGVKTIFHICGNLRAILAQVLQLEADCISVDAMVNIRSVKHQRQRLLVKHQRQRLLVKKFKKECLVAFDTNSESSCQKQQKELRLMGNVSTFLLEKGSPDKISQTAKAIIGHGVDILAPACGLSPMTPIENIRALSNVACALLHNWHDF